MGEIEGEGEGGRGRKGDCFGSGSTFPNSDRAPRLACDLSSSEGSL